LDGDVLIVCAWADGTAATAAPRDSPRATAAGIMRVRLICIASS
jgi:hypothetical protein